MSGDAAVLLALVLVGAAVLVVHFALVARVVRVATLPAWLRALSCLPPLTPWLGWRSGQRFVSVLWVLLVGTYLVLWKQA